MQCCRSSMGPMAAPLTPGDAAERYNELFPAVYLAFNRRDLKHSELSGASRGVMLHLAQSGPLTVGECAQHLDRAQSVVSEIVEQLVRHDWLAKVRDENDRRRTLVWLTEHGRSRLVEDQSVLSANILEQALMCMRPEERSMLIEGTQALLRAASASHTDTASTTKKDDE
jgi:DNA-binding MarR family transcriptional regulator